MLIVKKFRYLCGTKPDCKITIFFCWMQLNLPEHKFKIKETAHGLVIFDELRTRYVALTPEEWVRQNFVAYLINHKGFPAALMSNEVSMMLNGIKRRCDTLVCDNHGSTLLIAEYKAPSVAITQQVFDQIVRYNMVLRARYLIVTNGLQHYLCTINYEKNTYSFSNDIPAYSEIANK